MLSLFDRRPGYSRREFLRIGTLGLGGLSLPHLLGARALAAGSKSITTGKSVIFLYLFGGPSQFETFDPKMSAPDGIRSVNGEIATALPGVTFGSSFPQLAKRANQLAVVRSYVPGQRDQQPRHLSDRASQGDARRQSGQPCTRAWRA